MMYSQNQLSSNNTKGDAILHAIKCLDNERNDKVREEMMRAMGAAVHDDENAEIAVNRYKAIVSLTDWLIFSFSN